MEENIEFVLRSLQETGWKQHPYIQLPWGRSDWKSGRINTVEVTIWERRQKARQKSVLPEKEKGEVPSWKNAI